MREHLEPLLQATGRLCFFERVDQVSERAVVDAPTALRGGDGESDSEMGFTDARRTEEHHVLAPLDEAELEEAIDLLTPHGRLKGEIEFSDGLHRGQTARAHGRLQASVIAQGDLGTEQ